MTQSEISRYASYVSGILLPDVYAYMSSTEARDLLKHGETVEHLVPPSLLEMFD